MTQYGIIAHVPSSMDVGLINELHAKWVRLDFNWFEIEPVKGQFNFKKLDTAINGISPDTFIFPTLAYTPTWANGKGRNYAPTNINDWTNFVRECVNRYKDKISYWGIWNEPNLKAMWNESKDSFLNKILKPAYDQIKSINSSFKVVTADVSTMGDSKWNEWIEYFAKNQLYFDIFTYHVYSGNAKGVYEKIEKGDIWWSWLYPSKKPIKKYLDKISKPKWLTEVGWTTKDCTETQQARYYLDLSNRLKDKSYAPVIMYYELRDNSGYQFGIVKNDFVKKPAYTILQDLSK